MLTLNELDKFMRSLVFFFKFGVRSHLFFGKTDVSFKMRLTTVRGQCFDSLVFFLILEKTRP